MTSDEHEPDVPSDLGDELRRLFADDRLTLPVSHETETRVVTAARRRRRNRRVLATTGGVLAMAAVVVAGAVLSGLAHPSHRVGTAAGGPPVLSTTAVTTTTAPTVSTLAPDATDDSVAVLGPDGVGTVYLGMSWQKALATGLLRKSGPVTSAGCSRYIVLIPPSGVRPTAPTGPTGPRASTVPVWDDSTQIVVSVRDGVVQLIAGPALHTPEGIGIGSSREDLSEAYPKVIVPVHSGTTFVPVNGNPYAVYAFNVNSDGTVTSFSLRMAKSDCLG